MRKDYDEDEEETRESRLPSLDEAPADVIGLGDYSVAGLLAVVTFGLLMLWSQPLHPASWGPLAEAAGLRPASTLFPGLWRILVAGLVKALGLGAVVPALTFVGHGVMAVVTGLMYIVFRETLSLTVRLRLQQSPQRTLIARLAAGLAAGLFACADPVWRAGQFFAPDTFLVFTGVVACWLFMTFLQRGSLGCAYWAMLVLGVLSAETPFGFVAVALCWGSYFLALRHVLTLDMPLLNPYVEQVTKWMLTFLFVLGFLFGVMMNCWSFMQMHGLEALGWTTGDLPLQYLIQMWVLVKGCCSPMGWIIAIGVTMLPLIVTGILLPRASDEEQFLPYRIGLIFLLAGLLAFSQVTSVDALWFWTWIKSPEMVPSHFFLCFLMAVNAATLASAIAILGIDAFCRNHRRLALQKFSELRSEIGTENLVGSAGRLSWLRKTGLVVVPILLVAGVLPGRRQARVREMLGILKEYLAETVREAGNAKWLFTDGAFDAGVELQSALVGKNLHALSMMAGNNPYNVFLRARDMTDSEDLLALRSGAATLLRTWVRDKPKSLAECAVQLGFEMWKRDGRAVPPSSGVLSRSEGLSPADIASGVKVAQKLANEILAMYQAGGPARVAGPYVNDLFLFAQWRLARLARMRGERADLAGKSEEAIEDVRLSDELDRYNPSLQTILVQMERQKQQSLRQMTPREGLQLALVRADFALARRYAEPILLTDPEDPDANFGMGMSYFTLGQLTRAEEYLRRCLVRRPQEPAIYNNLAMLQLKTGRYEAAEKNAEKALALVPNSSEVQDTLKQIRRAHEAALAKGADKKGK